MVFSSLREFVNFVISRPGGVSDHKKDFKNEKFRQFTIGAVYHFLFCDGLIVIIILNSVTCIPIRIILKKNTLLFCSCSAPRAPFLMSRPIFNAYASSAFDVAYFCGIVLAIPRSQTTHSIGT